MVCIVTGGAGEVERSTCNFKNFSYLHLVIDSGCFHVDLKNLCLKSENKKTSSQLWEAESNTANSNRNSMDGPYITNIKTTHENNNRIANSKYPDQGPRLINFLHAQLS